MEQKQPTHVEVMMVSGRKYVHTLESSAELERLMTDTISGEGLLKLNTPTGVAYMVAAKVESFRPLIQMPD